MKSLIRIIFRKLIVNWTVTTSGVVNQINRINRGFPNLQVLVKHIAKSFEKGFGEVHTVL